MIAVLRHHLHFTMIRCASECHDLLACNNGSTSTQWTLGDPRRSRIHVRSCISSWTARRARCTARGCAEPAGCHCSTTRASCAQWCLCPQRCLRSSCWARCTIVAIAPRRAAVDWWPWQLRRSAYLRSPVVRARSSWAHLLGLLLLGKPSVWLQIDHDTANCICILDLCGQPVIV